MAEFPAMPLWTDAYLADTTHLTTLEHGAYLLLLMAMWRTKEKRLPNDDVKLARFAHLTTGQWKRVKPTLMEFFTVEGNIITQGRLTDEANAVKYKSAKQSDRAKSRWLKNNETDDATAKPDECREDASLTLNPYPLSSDTEVSSDNISSDETKLQNGSNAPTGAKLAASERKQRAVDEVEFDAWYAAYPRHEGKGQARKAYKSARKKAEADTLLSGARQARHRYAETERNLIPMPATWLNGERWLDQLDSPAQVAQPPPDVDPVAWYARNSPAGGQG